MRISRAWLPAAALAVVLLAAWETLARANPQPGSLWPSPATVLAALVESRSSFLANTGATLLVAGLGFAGGAALAAALSLIALRFEQLGENLYRVSLALYSLPLIALAPVLAVWLGIGLATKVTIALLAAFFPVVVNLTQALRSTNPQAMELMTVLGATRAQALWRVQVPYALPAVFAAFKIAAPNAIIGAMLAEWVGAERGLGLMLLFAMFNFQVPRLWATLIVATALTSGAYLLFGLLGRRLFPWHASVSDVERLQ